VQTAVFHFVPLSKALFLGKRRSAFNHVVAMYEIAVSSMPLEAKIPNGSPFWNKFNASFYVEAIHQEKLLDLIYQGYAITTCHAPRWRTAANYARGQHLGLDFDTEDIQSSLSVLMDDPFISTYASLIHTTMSHTEEKPRARAIFLLDIPIMQAKNYALAATALLWSFGTADQACKDAARFWYGAPNCEFEFLGKTLPLSVLKNIIKNYQGVAQDMKRPPARFFPPASQQKIADALKKIPPWGISYDEWLTVLMGLHTELGDAGLPLAEQWAEGKDGEVATKWRSFKKTGNTS